jgi:hypothetical protein
MNADQLYVEPLVMMLEPLYYAVEVEHSHVNLVSQEEFEKIDEADRAQYMKCM